MLVAHSFFIVGGSSVYESRVVLAIIRLNKTATPVCAAVLELRVREDVYPSRKPFRMRNVTLTFPVAHAHTCLLETGGPLTFYPSNLQWHRDSPCFSASVSGSIHWCPRD
jgi:hypothetical protein